MKVIVLTGLSNTGKTDTFEKIREKLSVYEKPIIVEQLGSDPRDLHCIFPTLRIGLYPMGDYVSHTRRAILSALENKLNVLIYAYSQSFRAFIRVCESFSNIDIEILYKKMSVNAGEFDKINEIEATNIINNQLKIGL